MLIVCQECGLQVSDKAIACPHCGFPIKPELINKRTYTKSNKRKRLPNGFGQISEIKNQNLRKPFRAMVCVGKSNTGRPISKPLKPVSYFKTYNEAYAALVEYNKNPYDLSKDITVEELYDRWFKDYSSKARSYTTVYAMRTAWKYCHSIYNMRAVDVRVRHIKGCMENGTRLDKPEKPLEPRTQNAIKILFNLMFDYALEYELVETNYSRNFTLTSELVKKIQHVKRSHQIYTESEIETLWENINKVNEADMLLIQCYSGWRPRELLSIKISDVDLEERVFKGGMKTEAGTDRIVPIHSKIFELVKNRYNYAVSINSEFLFNHKKKPYKYVDFVYAYRSIKVKLNLDPNHRFHDGRTHFVTMAKKYNADEYAIKYIVGHKINDITEKVYTRRNIDWLREEIEKIK